MRRIVLAVFLFFVLAGPAYAGGGHYAFTGGTKAQRATVTAALEASSFNWSLVPRTIDVRIGPDLASEATPGIISLNSEMLDSGSFAWGVVQHEYAHQVDFFLLGDAERSVLFTALGGASWWQTGGARLAHGDLTSERFASTLAWAYWQSSQNAMRPASAADEAAHVDAAAFRALLQAQLGRAVGPISALPSAPSKAPALRKRR